MLPACRILPLHEASRQASEGQGAMHTLDVVAPGHSGRAFQLKSAPYLRLDGNNLRGNAAHLPAAVFNGYVWVFGQHYSTEFDISTPCLIRFEGTGTAPSQYGPFPALHLDGPSLFFGPRFEEPLARYDQEKHQWLDCRQGTLHDAVVIEAVNGPGLSELSSLGAKTADAH
jgi:hypothetical protein